MNQKQKAAALRQKRQARQNGLTTNAIPRGDDIATNALLAFNQVMTQRADMLKTLFDERRDIDKECGYPNQITEEQLRKMYDRELGKRVVSIYPEETWQIFPDIYEDPDADTSTPFEETWRALDKKRHILHYLHRIDELSGVGHFGVILWGLDDGKHLHESVDGSDGWEEATGVPQEGPGAATARRLLYLRVFDESLVDIVAYETDKHNPRYGLPTFYNITFSDPRTTATNTAAAPDTTQIKVHWSRCTHIADNRRTSEVMGVPRMEPVWNRLYDLVKIMGGSGEMFWRGGFPGLSLETQPGLENAVLDVEETRKAMEDYMNGLQRYIQLSGMTTKSLAPQIADPTNAFEVQIKVICVTLGVPYRVFMGIEEGVVSGDQATKAWNGRLINRQHRYVTPMLIDPVLQRLVDYGILAAPAEPRGWTVDWPDITSPDEADRAKIALTKIQTLAAYITSGSDTLVPPMEFLTKIWGLEEDAAEAILETALDIIERGDDPEDKEVQQAAAKKIS